MQLLTRHGAKSLMAKKILRHFPQHKIYIEPFFGAGGMFFSKPKAHNNIVNDVDGDVFNLFQVVVRTPEKLIEVFHKTPYNTELYEFWLRNKESDVVMKALRFLYLSNFTLYSVKGSLGLSAKKNEYYLNFESLIEFTNKKLQGVQFANFDFRKFLKSIRFIEDGRDERSKTFIYADPPYLNTKGYSEKFTEMDFFSLVEVLVEMKCKFAISEFESEHIKKAQKQHNLNLYTISERVNIKNKRVEILLTNYENTQGVLFE